MRRLIVTLALSVSIPFYSMAQFGKVKIDAPYEQQILPTVARPDQCEFIGFRNPPSLDLSWQPSLTIISKNENEDQEALEKIKEYKTRLKQSAIIPQLAEKTTSVNAPTVGLNYTGVSNGGTNTPLDNTIAVSNGGIVVAMVNSNVSYFTTTSGTATYTHDLYAMINDATLTNNVCDPKVIYDNVADRFIFYVQVCDAVVAHSKIVLGFSKTNNPSAGWWIYKFTGNPLSDNSWFDYPKLGISNDEVFVTGNLFHGGSNSFNQSVIYQIPKSPCYSGAATPSWHYYSGLTNAFTILPLSYGQSGSYGPGIYLVTNSGSNSFGGSAKLYDITNNFASGSAVLNSYNVTMTSYSPPGNASQMGGTKTLDIGDTRPQDGFYMHGVAHYTFNTDAGSGWCGIRYNRITISSLACVSSDLSAVGTSDLCYGAVQSCSADSNDKSVIVAFNQSATTFYPRTCAAKCDNSMAWSPITVVKSGSSYINYSWVSGSTERWGDYTGLCRKYNDVPVSLWMAGMIGSTAHSWTQWIAKLQAPSSGILQPQAQEDINMSVFPNPVVETYKVKFTLKERENVSMNITDMQGRVVKELYSGIADEGENIFSFNKANLSPGIYSVNIMGTATLLKNEKIVIESK